IAAIGISLGYSSGSPAPIAAAPPIGKTLLSVVVCVGNDEIIVGKLDRGANWPRDERPPMAYNPAQPNCKLRRKGMTMNPYTLSDEQKAFYHQNGYLIGLPAIYSAEEMRQKNEQLPNLLA